MVVVVVDWWLCSQLRKKATPLPMGAGQGRHFHCQSAGQKLFLPAVRQGAM
jgi:hypothetical protein